MQKMTRARFTIGLTLIGHRLTVCKVGPRDLRLRSKQAALYRQSCSPASAVRKPTQPLQEHQTETSAHRAWLYPRPSSQALSESLAAEIRLCPLPLIPVSDGVRLHHEYEHEFIILHSYSWLFGL